MLQKIMLKYENIDKELLNKFDSLKLEEYGFVPIKTERDKIIIAIQNENTKSRLDVKDYIRFISGRPHIDFVLSDNVREILNKEDLSNDFKTNNDDPEDVLFLDSSDKSVPVLKFFNNMVIDALNKKATDIHLNPINSSEMKIMFRVDGSLIHYITISISGGSILVNLIKTYSGLNTIEKRIPQDGKTKVAIEGKNIDLRIATIPTKHIEKITIRILNNDIEYDINKLNLTKANLNTYIESLKKPYGLILFTGPTGSGKTTTLYASLEYLNKYYKEEKAIITIEEPVETDLNIPQVDIKSQLGLTFAEAMRSILRHDPDIVMLGEIRDEETAKIAMTASNTGHMVLSTLHTNTAIEAIARLKDLGIPSYLIGDNLVCIVNQRLVRKVCSHCSEEIQVTTEFRDKYNIKEQTYMKGKGCVQCNNTGYSGRIPITEVLTLTKDIRHLIVNNKTSIEIEEYLINNNYNNLISDGLYKVFTERKTTIEEVIRYGI